MKYHFEIDMKKIYSTKELENIINLVITNNHNQVAKELGLTSDMFTRLKKTNIDVMIGEVLIQPGDWLHGDRDGMVCIPKEILDEVLEKSQIAMETENKVRSAILEGMDPQEAYLKWRKF